MTTDELFRGQSAQLESLPHKDPNNVAASSDDIFKGQSAQFESLPHKSNNKRSNRDSKDKEKSSKNKKEGSSCSLFTGIKNRIFVVSIFVVILLIITTLGGILFLRIEESTYTEYRPYDNCFVDAKKMNTTSRKAVLDSIQSCIKSSHMLNEMRFGTLFSWSLYATVGYGHRFPFTMAGQLISVFYAWLFIPVYMALKIEFSEILAINIIFMGQKIKKLVVRWGPEAITKKMKKQSYHPSDLTLVLLLSILFSGFTILLTLIVMFTSSTDFFGAFYLTLHTVFQVGLGDVTPAEEWPTFVFVIPLVMVGDTLASFLFYYGIYRLQLHKLVICLTGFHEQGSETVPEGQQLVLAKSVGDFVTVTNHIMPLRATSAEIVQKEPYSSEVKDQNISTPPDGGRTDNTQTISTRVSRGPRRKKEKIKARDSPPASAKHLKTAVSVKTQEDESEKTISREDLRSQHSGSQTKLKTPMRDDLSAEIRRPSKRTNKVLAEEIPLLGSLEDEEQLHQRRLKPIGEDESRVGLKQTKVKKKIQTSKVNIDTATSPYTITPVKPKSKEKRKSGPLKAHSSRGMRQLHKKKEEPPRKENREDEDEGEFDTAIDSSELTPRSDF